MNDVPENIDAAPVFDESEAAVVDTFVVPSYLYHFWAAAEKLLLVGDGARIVHLGSLTGYPDSDLLARMPNTVGVGVESSESCVTLAAQKIAADRFGYYTGDPSATGFENDSFSHALLLHPQGSSDEREKLFREAARLLYRGGQLLVALPLSRSFPEVVDLIEEFALKYDDAPITLALERAADERLTIETLSEELELAGFRDIDFEVVHDVMTYENGRALLEDPAVRYFVVPQIEAWLDQVDLGDAMEYVSRAVDKYWSDSRLEMGLTVAAFSARL